VVKSDSSELHSTVVLGGKIILDAFTCRVAVILASKAVPTTLVRVARNGSLRTDCNMSVDENLIGAISGLFHSRISERNT